uniref:Uncharacterized protein n=1 Tax=Scleropages formosus TaxID=113540 RepID=A0A8C9TRV5_SCLFO
MMLWSLFFAALFGAAGVLWVNFLCVFLAIEFMSFFDLGQVEELQRWQIWEKNVRMNYLGDLRPPLDSFLWPLMPPSQNLPFIAVVWGTRFFLFRNDRII